MSMGNISVWVGAGLLLSAAAPAPPDAFAQTAGNGDSLPVYDDRLGPPRSRLIDIAPVSAPPATAATPVVETPTTAQTIELRRPSERPSAPEPTVTAVSPPPPPDPEPPAELVSEPAPVTETAATPTPTVEATSPAVAEVEEDVAEVTDTMPAAGPESEPEPEPAAVSLPEPEPEPEPEEIVTAAVAPQTEPAQTSAPASDGTIAILFPAGGAELPGNAGPQLDSVAAVLGADAAVRLQLKAYADGSDGAASAARRLSLSRALAVRGYLIDAGVSSTRIDVRALGSKFEDGPADRVDVISVK